MDENSYQRGDKHINIDNVINIDFIKEHKELHEVKKSRAIEAAGIWQVKYYLYYLKQRGVDGLKAKIDYPLLKKNLLVELSQEDEEQIERIMCDINAMSLPKRKYALNVHIMTCALFDEFISKTTNYTIRGELWDRVSMFITTAI